MRRIGHKYKPIAKSQLIKIGLSLLICIISIIIVNFILTPLANFFIHKEWVNWSLYEGFAPNSFYLFLLATTIFYMNKPTKNIFSTTFLLFCIYSFLFACFVVYDHYHTFYVDTHTNGQYNYDIFIHQIAMTFGDLLSPGILTFLVYPLGQFSTLLWSIFITNRLRN